MTHNTIDRPKIRPQDLLKPTLTANMPSGYNWHTQTAEYIDLVSGEIYGTMLNSETSTKVNTPGTIWSDGPDT